MGAGERAPPISRAPAKLHMPPARQTGPYSTIHPTIDGDKLHAQTQPINPNEVPACPHLDRLVLDRLCAPLGACLRVSTQAELGGGGADWVRGSVVR